RMDRKAGERSLSPLTSHLSPLTSHLSPLTSHLSPLTSHLSSAIEISRFLGDNAGMVTEETWVNASGNRLYARRWRVSEQDVPPIVLFHDSLGCIELWRSFPERLAKTTGHDVIAYDRLGFG